ncbi:MAG TPA: peptidoglycan DD-metalloendopeptidase family protein [Thermoanaerobaculia bacterium]|jgi:murein DD-endopeptidase MepM/ murein hydrolase activator NlpD|nr:peptidoglycan DD-metalloendopeptidase family protein [Thermoanaerobaculia bacterium]
MKRQGDLRREARRKRRTIVAAALPIAIPLILAAVAIEPSSAPTIMRASTVAPSLRYADLGPQRGSELPQHSVILTIEEDDTLDDVLVAGGLSRRDSALLTIDFGRSIDLRRIRPGNLLRFHYGERGDVDAVQLRVTGWGSVDAERRDHGTFIVTPRPARQLSINTIVSAEIDSSLYEALRNAGEQPQLVQQLVDIFQWDIDFFSLQKRDSFSVVVQKKFSGPDLVGYGPVLAARFIHEGNTYEAFRHELPNGTAGYYARNATPLRKQFLKAPLQFTRITSGFSKRRFHPVLHYFRPHHGVDYGAPVGTPVMTTADGVVIQTGYSRSEGNFIRIRHTSRIETMYLHLSRFAKTIRRGARVTQGNVIGYVGATGLVTGPHLDYRVSDGGKWLDPLKLKSITPDPLHGESLHRYKNSVAALLPRLSSGPQQLAQMHKRRALF